MKKLIFLILMVLFAAIFIFPVEEQKIEVIAKSANIRALPSLQGEIIGKALTGEVFRVEKQEGDWYKIKFQINKSGFLHKITVKEITGTIEVVQQPKKKKSKKKKLTKKKAKKRKLKKSKPKKIKRTRIKHQQEKLFSGFFLKGGFMTSPSGVDFGNSWITGLGFDSPIGKYLTWGLELQPYYRSFTIPAISTTFSSIAGNVFFNVKAGTNLGMITNSLKFMNLYLGVGAGTQLVYQSVKFSGVTDSEFIVNFAWHILFGTEFNIGKLNLIVEWQFDKTIVKNLDPSTVSTTFLMFGIRF